MAAKLTREEVEQIVKEVSGGKSELPRLNNRDLSRLDLSNIDFNWANLGGSNLSETNLSGTKLIGVDCIGTDFSRAILTGANLTSANLSGAKLFGTDLSGADLTMTNLLGAILVEANLSRAQLYKTDLSLSGLAGVNFTGADLSWADLTGAVLSEVILNEAQVWGTIFGGIDLREVRGLETVTHLGPSSIDTHTFIYSDGEIPEVFLRGCGLSDLQIDLVKLHNSNLTSKQITSITEKINELLSGKTIQYYSCFISYSSTDEAFTRHLHNDLQQKGVRCWFAPEDMKIGDKIRPRINESIRIHDKLLLVLSKHSINSEWVESEVEAAREEERKRSQTVLFPVRLDEAVMETNQAWAADIRRTRHIGDFSRWKNHDSYQRAFERLLRDLKAEG